MPEPRDFLIELLENGRCVFRRQPDWDAPWSSAECAYVGRQFERYRLTVAGPPLAWDAGTTVQAARVVLAAAWFLVHRTEPETTVVAALSLSRAPATPVEHLSADLFLRFLPVVHRRAQAIGPADALAHRLEALLRRWPLSGVLADVAAAPSSPLDFHGHAGLQWLYAERLARHLKPAWAPPGLAGQRVEWTLAEMGRDPALLLPPAASEDQPLEERDT